MHNDREVILILGKTGSGKSCLFRDLINKQKRFIIFDTLSEYKTHSPAFPAVFIETIGELSEYLHRNFYNNYRIVFDPSDPDRMLKNSCGVDLGKVSEVFFELCNSLNDVTIGIEELAYYVNANYAPEGLRKIVRFGRHARISLFATTQRPRDIPPIVRAQITKLISFRQHEPRDIDWIRDVIGEQAHELISLKKFEYGKGMESGTHYKEVVL